MFGDGDDLIDELVGRLARLRDQLGSQSGLHRGRVGEKHTEHWVQPALGIGPFGDRTQETRGC